MKLTIILLGTVFCTILFQTTTSSKNSLSPFIYDGLPAKEGQFPYMGFLAREPFGILTPICGCVILNSRWVVTALHCLYLETNILKCIVNVGSISIFAGIQYEIIKAIKYDPQASPPDSFKKDVALLKVGRNIVFSDLIQPIQIEENYLGGGVGAVLSGWGETEKGTTTRPMYTNLTTMNQDTCKQMWWDLDKQEHIFEQHICSDTPQGRGPCQVDSGSPLVANGKLIGIVSFGIGGNCGTDFPAVYARISYFKHWIMETIEDV